MSEPVNDNARERVDAELFDHYIEAGRPQLVESFVCLLDVLGTSATTLEDAQRFLSVTHTAFSRAQNEYETPHISALVRWFSDNAAIALPSSIGVWGSEGTRQINGISTIVLAGMIQLELSNLGLFLRGGIEVGPFFASDQFIFGPALVDAHQLESKVAKHPRIVLSESFAEYARAQAADADRGFPWNNYADLLALDDDGKVFVNYLALVEDKDEVVAWLDNHLQLVRSHRRTAQCDNVRQKYDWVARYHDRYCRRYLIDDPRLEALLDDPANTDELKLLG